MSTIFLSYAREDKACAERLARVLEQARHEVWWDRHIGTGREFSAEIEAALEKAEIVLVVWSKERRQNRLGFATKQQLAATAAGSSPVLIDGRQPPIGFRQFQALDLTGWKGRDKESRTKELIDAVAARLSGTAAPFRRAKGRFGWVRGRAVWAASAALLLIIGGIMAVGLLNSRDRQRGTLSKPTFAVLPFTTASSDAELRQFGSQTRALARAHVLAERGPHPTSGFRSARRSLRGRFPDLRRPKQERRQSRGDRPAERSCARDDGLLHRFDASREDARNLPERIGAQMAGYLAWRSPLMMLDRRHPIIRIYSPTCSRAATLPLTSYRPIKT